MEKLKAYLEKLNIPYMENVPMSVYSSFRTGGNASIVILPGSIEQIISVLSLEMEDLIILGSCSNILVSDKGIQSPIMLLQNNFSDIIMKDGLICTDAGAKLSALTAFSISNEFKGLEFAGGIPGSVGGGVFMNAGAYGGELKDCIYEVYASDRSGNIRRFSAEECEFSYRHSIFMENGYIVLRAVFRLEEGDPEVSREILRDLNRRRKEKQPLEYPSAGSTFKRPVGYFAGALIQDAGLKGCRIGGAEVSEKHSGFIINKENATSDDIYRLIQHVQKKVFENSGVIMEPEVRFIGDFQ